MIDRLKEVLGMWDSRKESAAAAELLRQWRVTVPAPAGEERSPVGQSFPGEGWSDLPPVYTGTEFGEQEEPAVTGLATLVGLAVQSTAVEHGALPAPYRKPAEADPLVESGSRPGTPVVIGEDHAVGGGLTVRELDQAVRRDSRRYDGAVHIY